MDLHLHTPASADYREANVTYLDILKKAEQRGLDIIAFADHNTVAGYRRYLDEVADLEFLERRNRMTDEERNQLAEFRRLQEKLLILPGFEFTATLGFHILAIFPPDTTVRDIEHLLLDLHVPSDRLDVGSGEVGATSDVITAYRLMNEAGALVIAAHANSSHGVAMPGFDFGGQTRISYTQDENLHALEVTDLTSRSRRRTALFFSGTKPEYPRKMHSVQGSDAHRLTGIPGNNQELGVGDRPTEILLEDLSFDAIMTVLLGKDFSKIRPFTPAAPQEFDPIYSAREEGETLVQSFHEAPGKHGIDRRILQDVVALANTNGGTIYIGATGNVRQPVLGVAHLPETIRQLRSETSKHIAPPLDVQIDTLKSGGKSVLQIIVPRGSEVPYALDGTQIYVRSENETSLAVRDEIVNLVRDALAVEFAARVDNPPLTLPQGESSAVPEAERTHETAARQEHLADRLATPPPHTGVEIVASKARAKGDMQYTMRDLRNNRIIHNVTRSSARKLWQYAINEHEENPAGRADIKWLGDIGVIKTNKRAGKLRYDLVQRDSSGELHAYYGVTDDGIHGAWKDLIESSAGEATVVEEPENGTSPADGYDILPEAEPVEATDDQDLTEEAFPAVRAAPPEIAAESAPDVGGPESPRLLFPPGRDLLPPVRVDLTPSVSSTDDDSEPRSKSRANGETEPAAEFIGDIHTPAATVMADQAVLELEPAVTMPIADTDIEPAPTAEEAPAAISTMEAEIAATLPEAPETRHDLLAPSVTVMMDDQVVLPFGLIKTTQTPTKLKEEPEPADNA